MSINHSVIFNSLFVMKNLNELKSADMFYCFSTLSKLIPQLKNYHINIVQFFSMVFIKQCFHGVWIPFVDGSFFF